MGTAVVTGVFTLGVSRSAAAWSGAVFPGGAAAAAGQRAEGDQRRLTDPVADLHDRPPSHGSNHVSWLAGAVLATRADVGEASAGERTGKNVHSLRLCGKRRLR